MSVTASDLSITYGGLTFGAGTARQVVGDPVENMKQSDDFIEGSFEFAFITTAASDAAFATEIIAVRNALRTPRGDLVVTQNAQTLLSRKHSDNTGLDTFPRIMKDGDDADTGRSRYFKVRIEYELPADNTSTSFRRGATVLINYSEAGRRTVTISGVYTANSTDGTTTSSAQYLAQIAAAETSLLNVVDSSARWERVGQPQIEYFETNKVTRFTRVYREVNFNQSGAGVDDVDIINPHMEVSIEQIAPGDSFKGTISSASSGGGGPGQTTSDPTASGGGTFFIVRPILITVSYDCSINFDTQVGATKVQVYNAQIRPWMVARAQVYNPGGTFVIIGENPLYEDYENHFTATLQCVSYSVNILRQKVTYAEPDSTGKVLDPVSTDDPLAYYEYQGPEVDQMVVTEETERLVLTDNVRQYVGAMYKGPGFIATTLGDKWVLVSSEPTADIRTQGLSGGGSVNIATEKIVSVFQFRNRKAPSKAGAGVVTGGTVTG